MDSDAVRGLLEPALPPGSALWETGEPQRSSVRLRAEDVRQAATVLRERADARFVTLTAVDTGLEIELIYL
ncbi:MAG TPA: hypothetical protein VMG58_08775, partial [Candidatus Sulfotelmatobacter sp.]|nr:hypothetical protein [Candidatus Sulfotelmatobacter sp.]